MPQYIQLIDGVLCLMEYQNEKPIQSSEAIIAWQKSAVKTPFHDSQKNEAEKLAYSFWINAPKIAIHKFTEALSEGILIPDGLVEIKNVCECYHMNYDVCFHFNVRDFAFLKESKPVEETNEAMFTYEDMRKAFDFGLHTLSVYRNKKLEKQTGIFENFMTQFKRK